MGEGAEPGGHGASKNGVGRRGQWVTPATPSLFCRCAWGGEGRLRKGAEPRSHAAREAGRDVKSRGVFPGWLWQSVSAVNMKRGRTSAENAPLSPAKSQGRVRARLTCGGRAARFQR